MRPPTPTSSVRLGPTQVLAFCLGALLLALLFPPGLNAADTWGSRIGLRIIDEGVEDTSKSWATKINENYVMLESSVGVLASTQTWTGANTFLGDVTIPGVTVSGTAWQSIGGYSVLRTTSDLVGIGTTVPTEKLEVTGNIKALYGVTAATLTVTGATQVSSITASQTVAASSVTGYGAGLTSLSPANITAGNLTMTNVTATVQVQGSTVNAIEAFTLNGATVSFVPTNGILIWTASTNCPAGYTEVTELRARFPIGADILGATSSVPDTSNETGGTNSHQHAISLPYTSAAGALYAAPSIDHTIYTNPTEHYPPFLTVIFCKSTGAPVTSTAAAYSDAYLRLDGGNMMSGDMRFSSTDDRTLQIEDGWGASLTVRAGSGTAVSGSGGDLILSGGNADSAWGGSVILRAGLRDSGTSQQGNVYVDLQGDLSPYNDPERGFVVQDGAAGTRLIYASSSSGVEFFTTYDGSEYTGALARFSVAGSTLMVTGGRVGIGTSSPTSILDVVGDSNFCGNMSVCGDFQNLSTMTVQGNAFSVGGSTFTVLAGSVTAATLCLGGTCNTAWPADTGVVETDSPTWTGVNTWASSATFQNNEFSIGGATIVVSGGLVNVGESPWGGYARVVIDGGLIGTDTEDPLFLTGRVTNGLNLPVAMDIFVSSGDGGPIDIFQAGMNMGGQGSGGLSPAGWIGTEGHANGDGSFYGVLQLETVGTDGNWVDPLPMVITQSGSVGLSTEDPLARLEVQDTDTNGQAYVLKISSANGNELLTVGKTGNVELWEENSYMQVAGTVTVAGNAFSVGGSTLTIAGGKVGIGTTIPADKLHLNGTMTFEVGVDTGIAPGWPGRMGMDGDYVVWKSTCPTDWMTIDGTP